MPGVAVLAAADPPDFARCPCRGDGDGGLPQRGQFAGIRRSRRRRVTLRVDERAPKPLHLGRRLREALRQFLAARSEVQQDRDKILPPRVAMDERRGFGVREQEVCLSGGLNKRAGDLPRPFVVRRFAQSGECDFDARRRSSFATAARISSVALNLNT